MIGAIVGCEPTTADVPWPVSPTACAPDVARTPYVPRIAGEYRRVFVPPGTRYVNDHTIVRGPDGWHLFGITDESAGSPFEERAFLHATASALEGPWVAEDDALVADAAARESFIWAPHVVPREGGGWLMHYFSAAVDGRGIRRADSDDLWSWTRVNVDIPSSWPAGGRDPFVLRHAGMSLVFSAGVSDDAHGQIVVSASVDGESWADAEIVLEDPRASYPWGGLESPAIVEREGYFYLFVNRGLADEPHYFRTLVFRSCDPRAFGGEPIAELWSHAAEIVEDGGRWFITSAGWTSQVGEERRGLLLAPLEWIRE